MLSFNQMLDAVSASARADMEAATYFTLEACCDYGDNVGLAFVEDASYFAIHAGMAGAMIASITAGVPKL